jgi:hypothetical protein
MGKAIFVSYKYSDAKVQALPGVWGATTARHYVDEIEKLLEAGDNIYKGEDDGEDLSTLEDSTIASKLGDKIFYSSLTIVLISKGMRNQNLSEKEQWIPWEISYSLKEQSREGGNSKTNAVLAIVVPDEYGSYSHFFTDHPECNSVTWHTESVFQILRDNMFNRKNKEDNVRHCNGTKIYDGNPSYIHAVKWEHFKQNVNTYIDIASAIRQNIDSYELTKTVK